jgi:hypothetical protein
VTASDKRGFIESFAQYKWIFLWVFAGTIVFLCLLLLTRSGRAGSAGTERPDGSDLP